MKQNSKENLIGLVFDIQRYSLGDGQGIRTTVFMKGCNLRCRWCQNPESFSPKPEAVFKSDRCMKCGACAEVCPVKLKPDLCIACGACAKVCPTKARYIIGQSYTAAELLSVVERDSIFFKESGGGVTLSGGEATLQLEFVHEFLRACRAAGINTAIETNGHFDKESFKQLLPLLDHIFFDIKSISSEKHKMYTGIHNERILENAAWLADSFHNITFRIPLIPGMTLTNDNMKDTVIFLDKLEISRIEFCLYQNGWENKLHWLNTKQEPINIPSLSEKDISDLIRFFNASGIAVRVN